MCIRDRIEAAVTRYKLGDGTTPDYRAELITSGTETRNTDREYWGIELCFPEGDQYTLCLYAADGNLTSWIRWPPGYFDDPDFSGIRQLSEGGPLSAEYGAGYRCLLYTSPCGAPYP